jgi:CBS-domain-containing membrane protein
MTEYRLRVAKSTFAFLIVFVNALATLLGVLVQHYIQDTTVASAVGVFVGVVSNGLIVWLTVQEANAPPP